MISLPILPLPDFIQDPSIYLVTSYIHTLTVHLYFLCVIVNAQHGAPHRATIKYLPATSRHQSRCPVTSLALSVNWQNTECHFGASSLFNGQNRWLPDEWWCLYIRFESPCTLGEGYIHVHVSCTHESGDNLPAIAYKHTRISGGWG